MRKVKCKDCRFHGILTMSNLNAVFVATNINLKPYPMIASARIPYCPIVQMATDPSVKRNCICYKEFKNDKPR